MLRTAHDIRQFSAVVIGNCDIVDKRLVDIRKAVRHIEDILVASLDRKATAKAPLGHVDINKLVRDLPELAVLRETIEVRLELDDQLPILVAGSGLEIHQALVNLCSNARNAMAARPARAAILTLATRKHPGWAAIVVKDTGPGIDPFAFERLKHRMNGGAAEIIEGHGHGLQSVKAEITKLGGRVEVDSVIGAGTRFTLWLPVA